MSTTPAPILDTPDERAWTLPVYAQLDLHPLRGDGAWLEMDDGRRVLDMYGGHAVASLGYAHPRLVAALRDQVERLTFQSNLLPLELRARACAALARFAPPGLDRVFLVNSGAEANENALKLAFGQPGRTRIVAVEGAFHGRTAAAAAVTWGSEKWYGFPQQPFEVSFVSPRDLAALDHLVGEDTAALIVEPVQGVAGALDLPAEFLAAARRATRDAGALLIFDEVQCGMGRTGRPFAADHYGITPDIITTAKGLAGGFPAGAVITTAQLAAELKIGELGTTFGGGPMACAAIETVLAVIRDENLLERVRVLSAQIRESCLVGPVRSIQGAGFLLGLVCSRPAREIQAELLEHDILAGTSADPRVLRLLPPLTLETEHVARLAAALAEIAP
ncbi:aminotransferase class III-fold pyridoxal phosphate-dependent enzyme [Wenzhouxiangella sp. XN24]|uniref:aspartate aminotransferase family protein n=1 Tax=Wenzhouxiangella sp. XN24 TaxID=2713569 RepID=UPI0013EA4147|nr:aminotransferase class III-fold pyridoxal phosphate-dependent enzyme [Wenzhouxiangella sp. XN24]NGX17306.1 aspartate aminotransferase family protein [Wenzhouxiangella sp. XN24]